MYGVSENTIKEAVNQIISSVQNIATEVWNEAYPNLKDNTLKAAFVAYLLMETNFELKERLENGRS